MEQTLLPIEMDDDFEEFSPPNEDLVVYSRDWTVQTIVSQIEQGNIDLNPKFQRRNAWKDDKRIRLIESLLSKFPVPEIVLAERIDKKRSFFVLDGKQRLQTLAGLYLPDKFNIWSNDKFGKSSTVPEISNVVLAEFINSQRYSNAKRMLDNADIRCTVVSNYTNDDVLYDIFYRLNTGSTPLSSQELRQVLNKGEFSEFLVDYTNEIKPIHKVLGIDHADDRLVDIDLIIRCLAFYRQGEKYRGSQKSFLDNFVNECNNNWVTVADSIVEDLSKIMTSIEFMAELIGYDHIGRKIISNQFDWRFNKILFEVQILFAININIDVITPEIKSRYISGLNDLINMDSDFRMSIESTTKSVERYKLRFDKYYEFIVSILGNNVVYTNKLV